jgi:hypothetical protein
MFIPIPMWLVLSFGVALVVALSLMSSFFSFWRAAERRAEFLNQSAAKLTGTAARVAHEWGVDQRRAERAEVQVRKLEALCRDAAKQRKPLNPSPEEIALVERLAAAGEGKDFR